MPTSTATEDDGWNEVSLDNDHVWDREGSMEGVLISAKEGIGPNESMLYKVKDDEGIIWSIWGSTVLDTKMADVSVGDRVKIEPPVLTKSPKTGRQYMDFKVYYKSNVADSESAPVEDPFDD